MTDINSATGWMPADAAPLEVIAEETGIAARRLRWRTDNGDLMCWPMPPSEPGQLQSRHPYYLSRAEVLKAYEEELNPQPIPVTEVPKGERTLLCHLVITSLPTLDGGAILRAMEKEVGSIAKPQQRFEFYVRLTMPQIVALQDRGRANDIVRNMMIESACPAYRISCSVLDR